jgi:hypothetical protein
LTKLAATNALGTIRDGVGIEVVYCALLERLAEQDEKLEIVGSRRLIERLRTHHWLRESARSDGSTSRYAHEILSDRAKRWFAEKLSQLEQGKYGKSRRTSNKNIKTDKQ